MPALVLKKLYSKCKVLKIPKFVSNFSHFEICFRVKAGLYDRRKKMKKKPGE